MRHADPVWHTGAYRRPDGAVVLIIGPCPSGAWAAIDLAPVPVGALGPSDHIRPLSLAECARLARLLGVSLFA